jgi:cytochrome c-type biogenesis protein CcmH/NrfF
VTRLHCNCGCGEILSGCSHPECRRRVPLNHEIALAVRNGKTDAEVLGDLEKKYGPTILRLPSFRGFNVLLWIVPIAGGLIALGVVVWRRCSFASGLEADEGLLRSSSPPGTCDPVRLLQWLSSQGYWSYRTELQRPRFRT